IKVMGSDLDVLAETSQRIADVVRTDERTREHVTSAYADQSMGGYYLHFDVNAARDRIARYGLTVGDVQDTIDSAVGGMNVSHTVEGLARYPINVRYPRELRDSAANLEQVLVATPSGAQVPLGQLVPIDTVRGAPMIKSENGRLTSWVYVDITGADVGSFVQNAQQAIAQRVEMPAGTSLVWSGQYEYMQETWERLKVAAPAALVVIVLLLYLATRSWFQVILVTVTVVLFAPIGSVWLLWLADYNISGAVWVGMIALMGLAAETGLVMLLYLDNSVKRYAAEGRLRDADDLWYAIHDGAVQRIRPKTMTVVTTFTGLLPLMLTAQGAGADTMRRLAAPMVGGLVTAFVLELLIYPVVFYLAVRATMRGAA
ncbi:MAG: efflux RND transporter permease subunit, partial [Phycisphaeraceae bacterium]